MTQGERVRMIRKHPNVNLTLEKFGEKLGIKKSALSLIENGKNNLKVKVIHCQLQDKYHTIPV